MNAVLIVDYLEKVNAMVSYIPIVVVCLPACLLVLMEYDEKYSGESCLTR